MTTYETVRPTIAEQEQKVRDAGFRVSAGSWEDENHVYACSIEVCRGTYGHPMFEAYWTRKTW